MNNPLLKKSRAMQRMAQICLIKANETKIQILIQQHLKWSFTIIQHNLVLEAINYFLTTYSEHFHSRFRKEFVK